MGSVRRAPCPRCRKTKGCRHPEAKKSPYEVRYRAPDGSHRTETFDAKADADARRATVEADMLRGAWVDPHAQAVPFSEVAAAWLASNGKKRAATLARDETILRLHVLPTLGARQVGSVSRANVRALVAAWSEHMKPRTVRRTYGVMRAVFRFAVDEDLIVRSPCRGIHLPSVTQERRPEVGVDELAALADALGPDYAPMAYLGVLCGLRWGEVAALRVRSFDFLERGTVTVTETVTRAHGRQDVGEPKSEAGRRTLTLPAPLRDVLADHLRRRGLDASDGEAFVFGMPSGGGPLDYVNWRRRVWQPACHSAGLDGLTFHDLRRANATAMVAEGVDIKTAQTRLGHSDPRLTLAVYAQATSEGDRRAADQLGEKLMGRRERARNAFSRGGAVVELPTGETRSRRAGR